MHRAKDKNSELETVMHALCLCLCLCGTEMEMNNKIKILQKSS